MKGTSSSRTLKILLLSSPSLSIFLFSAEQDSLPATFFCLLCGFSRKGRLAQTKGGTAAYSYFGGNVVRGTTVSSF